MCDLIISGVLPAAFLNSPSFKRLVDAIVATVGVAKHRNHQMLNRESYVKLAEQRAQALKADVKMRVEASSSR